MSVGPLRLVYLTDESGSPSHRIQRTFAYRIVAKLEWYSDQQPSTWPVINHPSVKLPIRTYFIAVAESHVHPGLGRRILLC